MTFPDDFPSNSSVDTLKAVDSGVCARCAAKKCMVMSTLVALPSFNRLSTRGKWIGASFVRTPLTVVKLNPLGLVGLISRPALCSVAMVHLPTSICGKVSHLFDGSPMLCCVASKEVG